MQAIITKYLPVTDKRPSRVKAECWLGTITLPWDHALNSTENHKAALQAMCNKLNETRDGDLHWCIVATGSSVDGKGYTAIIDLE